MVSALVLSSLLAVFIIQDDTQSAAGGSPSTPIGTITGAIDDRFFGWNVSSAGDINDDGYDDIIVGAPYSGVVVEASDWWNDNWTLRKRLSFDNTAQSENLTNFPVMVKLDLTNFDYAKANPDASDLRFIDSDAVTELTYHIEEWNSLGESNIWVNVTRIDGNSNSDYIWMYYNNPAATNSVDVWGTYDSEFVGVWHLNDSVGSVMDSTSNGHNGTALGGVDRSFTGMVDGAYDFEGDDDYIDFGNTPQLMITGDITLEAWINIDTDPATYDYAIMQLGDSGEAEAENWLYLLVLTPGGVGLDVDIGHEYGGGIDEKRTYDANLQLDNWYYLVATRDVSVNEWRLFIDGVQFDTPFVYGNGPSGGDLGNLMVCMDWFNAAWRFTDGTMDELRISSIPRSADWISAQYLSMTDDFITFGNEEIINGTTGAAYVFYGGPGVMGDITVGNADIIINGSALHDRFGWSVSAGNVTGDDTTDILVGAPGYDGGQNTGAVYIFDGDALSADADGRLVASEATTMIIGENPSDRFGSAVTGAGDVDNDGNDDVIIGAPEYGASKGRAYIFFGDGSIPTTASEADVFLAGSMDNSRFGHSVSSAGDLNGDGYYDIIVGAPGENKAYIYFGGVDLTTTILSKPTMIGPLDNTNGNIDDLKLDDDSYYTVPKNGKMMFIDSFNTMGLVGMITGATLYVQYYTQNNYNSNDNITWAMNGQPLQDTDIEITQSGTEVTPPGYDLFVQGVDTLEELGTLDISLTNTETGGQVNVFFDYVWIEVTTNAPVPMLTLEGIGDFGWSLSDGGDVNGDGLEDVIIGAPDTIGSTPGQTHIKYGKFQGFDNETTGTTPQGWQQIGGGTNDAMVSENASYGSSGKSIEFNWTGGDLAEIRKVFPSASLGDKGVVEFCVRVSEIDNVKFYILMGNTTSGNWTSRLAFGSALAGEEDYIRYYEGNGDGTGTYVPLQPYTVDTWYHFRILSDSTTNSWDLYIDGILKVTDIGFVFDNTIPNFLSFHQFNAGNPHVDYVDNVVWLFNNPEVMITGETNGDQFGYSVVNTENLSGDVYADIIVGAPNANGNGSVYIFHGNDSWSPIISAASANNTLIGEYVTDGFGWSVSHAGDVNNDGQDDIIIGAPYFDDGANTDAGKVYIFFGPNVTYQPDLWINGNLDNVYQTLPAGAQIDISPISAGDNATWWITLQNDGSDNDTFDFGIVDIMLPGWTWEMIENGTKNKVNDGDFISLASGEWRNYTLNISSSVAAAPLDESSMEIGVRSQNGSTYDTVKAIARVTGDFPPEISDVQEVPDLQETGGAVNITCNVTDDIGVLEIWVNITLPGGGYSNVSMGKGTADQWFYKTVYAPLGLYLYTIWAKDTSSNWNSSSGHSFTIQDTTLPKITMVQDIPDPQETGGNVNISCDVTDNVMVDTVWINISLPGGGFINTSMYPGVADQWFLNTTYVTLGLYKYKILTNDTSNNWNTSLGYNFTIHDTTLPIISNVIEIPDPQEVNGWVNITCDITDNVGVDTVWINITLPGGGFNNVTMDPETGDQWFYNNTFVFLGLHQYTIWANDTSNNWNSSSGHSFTIQDTSLPVISNVIDVPDPQDTGGWINVSCDITDNIGVSSVWLNITLPGGGFINTSMDKGVGDQWFYNNTFGIIGLYQYTIWANDTSDNWNSSSGHSFTFQDTSFPVISNVLEVPDPQETGGYINISTDVIDDIGVSTVWVNITLPAGGYSNTSMFKGAGNQWFYNNTYVPLGLYQYTIWANDTTGNWNSSSGHSFTIQDTALPVISNVLDIPDPQETGSQVNISCDVTDNIGLGVIWINLTLPGGGFTNTSMDKGAADQWFNNATHAVLGLYQYTIWANDTSGNWNSSSGHSFTIQDTTLSVITNVLDIPDPQETGGNVNISCDVTDNIGVNRVWLNISLPGGGFSNVTMDTGSSNQWFHNSTFAPLGLYQYAIWVNDTSGNWNSSSGHSFTIEDTTLPVISNVLDFPDPQETGGDVNISCDVTDNVGLDEIWLNISLPGGGFSNVTMDPGAGNQWFINNTYVLLGMYQYTVWVIDTSGNLNSSSGQFVIQDTTLPTISDVTALPNPQELNGFVNLSANVTDAVGVYGAWIEITDPLGGLVGNFSMIFDSLAGRYYTNQTYGILGVYQFIIRANDTDGNWVDSSGHTFTIQDTTLPVIQNVMDAPDPQEVDSWVNISCEVSDNDAVGEVWINISLPGGGYTNTSMDQGSGNLWFLNNTFPDLGLYQYTIWANDTTGNLNSSSGHGFTIQDTELPEILNMLDTPDPQETGGSVNISCDVTDNVAVQEVWVNITLPGGGFNNVTMNQGAGSQLFFNSTYAVLGSYQYTVWTSDTSGNLNSSTGHDFIVQDTELPEIDNVLEGPDPQATGDYVNITCIVTDNNIIGTVWVNISLPGGGYSNVSMTPGAGNQWFLNNTYPIEGSHQYSIWVSDTSSNWNRSSGHGFITIDSEPLLTDPGVLPVLGYVDTIFTFTVNYSHSFNKDPSAITLNLTGPSGGTFGLAEVDPGDTDFTDGKLYYLTTTGLAIGTYSFHFTASDADGKWAVSSTLGFDVVNRIPMLSSPQVTPAVGYADTVFNFTVVYTDLDNHAPDVITVNITGWGIYNLWESDPADLDCSDGKAYYFNINGMSVGTAYTLHFAANDTLGDWAVETPEADVPDVLERFATLTPYNKTVKYSDNVFLNATLMQNGTPVAGENVGFYIDIDNSGTYEAGEYITLDQTDVDGTVSIGFSAMLIPGTYNYTAIYAGMSYSVSSSTAVLLVEPKPAIITTYDRISEEGQSVAINATLEDENGFPVPDQALKFYVDKNKDSMFSEGEVVGSGKTDGSGYVEATYMPSVSSGTYSIRVKYLGSGNYSVVEGSAFLIIQNTSNVRPLIVTPVPDQIKSEDSPPWELLLTPHEWDLEDAGEDLKWYLTGVDTSLYTVTGMNSTDDVFTFVPVPDAFGNDEVTLWLVDSSGGKTFQTLWVNLTPLNDRPKIEAINPLTVHFDDEYTYFFYNYISDIEDPKEDLVLSTDEPEHTTVDGLSITFLYPLSMNGTTQNVLVTVTDTEGGSTSTIVIVRVSNDWVPELEKELPDITLYEGEAIEYAFDLDDYFSDPDGDALFYVTGQSHVKIDIDIVTHVVNITAPEDWYGSETVSFHALDPINARVEDIVLITVLPINDEPSISDVPDLVVRFDQDYIFDLSGYIDDEDNEDSELLLSLIDPVTGLPIPGIEIDPNNNLGILINLPESMNGSIIQIQIRVSDGIDSNFTTINITVSNDFPPELLMPLPDVSFDEDTQRDGAFNIHHYFIDIDDVYLIYTTGHSKINVTINPSGSVDFSATADWYGSEEVTFRAADDSGALVECTITVSVIPVNDAPTISQMPDQIGTQGSIWVIDISEYLFDIDNNIEDLTVSVDSEYVSVVGYTLIFDYPAGIKEELITITVSDGVLESSGTLAVTITEVETPTSGPLLLDYIFWILLIPIIIAALLIGFMAYKRKVTAPFVDEVFLIANDGTLIAHNSMSLEEEIDKDILSGMLTGVKNLISDAFAREEGREKGLHKLEFGKRNIMLEKGNHFFIALVFSGVENKQLLNNIQKVIKDIEEKYGDVLENWTGDMHVFIDTDETLESLLSLEKLSEEERVQLKDARKRLKEAQELAIRELDIQLVNLLSDEETVEEEISSSQEDSEWSS
jgi:hypothetical protein